MRNVIWIAMLAAVVFFAVGCKEKTESAAGDGAQVAVKACGSDCAKPCCTVKADQKAACPPDCTKPCCADKAKSCPPDCTKPCCAVKDAAAAAGAAAEQTAATVAAVEQTMCPILPGNPIDKNIFVEYKGKKVYFCCQGCVEKFNAEPEKYVIDLPQFKQP